MILHKYHSDFGHYKFRLIDVIIGISCYGLYYCNKGEVERPD